MKIIYFNYYMEINISSKKYQNIINFLYFLQKCKIEARIIKTKNCVSNNNKFEIENGLNILFHNITLQKFTRIVWPYLKFTFKIKCCHIKYQNYDGCILHILPQ
jgi:hypothetical protein